MSFFKAIAQALIAVSFIAAAMPGAYAGSLAQTIKPITLRLGPGLKYPTASDLPKEIEVDVQRCQNRWCLLENNNQRGWASIDDITFGVEPRGWWTGPKTEQVSGGSGTVCFYTGENFTGEATCSKTGMVVPDLALLGLDNRFASVSVEGTISVHVCREFNFGSYCETIAADQPVLNRFLKNAVSSYRVW
jgi:uncharacterized protein YraI